jgi:membrane protein
MTTSRSQSTSPLNLLKLTVSDWFEDNALRLSAALAYYSVFSLAPLLIIAISIAGLLFGEDAARGAIENQLSGMIGPDAAVVVEDMISGAKQDTSRSMALVGIGVLFISASGVFGQLKDAMNTIWEVEVKPTGRWIKLIRDRFLSMTMVLGAGFLLLVSLVLSAILAATSHWLGLLFPIPGVVWQVVSEVISFGIITLMFAMFFKFLPDAVVRWKDVWIGAAITAGLFTFGKMLLGLYLGRPQAVSMYGAAGAFVLVLLWVYYSSCILLFGAEFTQVYAKVRGNQITSK